MSKLEVKDKEITTSMLLAEIKRKEMDKESEEHGVQALDVGSNGEIKWSE